jgi:hypothetical protein
MGDRDLERMNQFGGTTPREVRAPCDDELRMGLRLANWWERNSSDGTALREASARFGGAEFPMLQSEHLAGFTHGRTVRTVVSGIGGQCPDNRGRFVRTDSRPLLRRGVEVSGEVSVRPCEVAY